MVFEFLGCGVGLTLGWLRLCWYSERERGPVDPMVGCWGSFAFFCHLSVSWAFGV